MYLVCKLQEQYVIFEMNAPIVHFICQTSPEYVQRRRYMSAANIKTFLRWYTQIYQTVRGKLSYLRCVMPEGFKQQKSPFSVTTFLEYPSVWTGEYFADWDKTKDYPLCA